jgi:hypothetical protein
MPITAAMLAYWGGRQRVSRAFWRAWLIPGVVSTMLSFVVVRSLLAALDPVPGYEREVAAFFYSVMLAFLVWLAGFICIVRCRRNSDGTEGALRLWGRRCSRHHLVCRHFYGCL